MNRSPTVPLRVLGCAAATAAVLLAGAPPARVDVAEAHGRSAYWSFPKLMRELAGARVTIGGRRYRIDAAITACTGERRDGRRRGFVVRGGTRMWKHFTCVEASLDPRRREIAFRVHVLSRTRFVLTNVHFKEGHLP